MLHFLCRILIASIMEEYNKDAWETLISKCEEVGVDAFEVNFSCPHGMPERKMGMAMGQDCEVLKVQICRPILFPPSYAILELSSFDRVYSQKWLPRPSLLPPFCQLTLLSLAMTVPVLWSKAQTGFMLISCRSRVVKPRELC